MLQGSDEPHSVRAVQRRLLEQAEGALDTAAVAELLGLTPEGIRERARQGTLLSVEGPSGVRRYPRVQFSEAGLVDGLEEVLAAMDCRDPWMRLQLILDRDVLGALQDGRVEDAVRAVASYLPRDEG